MCGTGSVAWVVVVAALGSSGCGEAAKDGCSHDLECKADRICVERRCVAPVGDAPRQEDACGSSGYCTATTKTYAGDLGGLAGADRLCQTEFPGSHFYRRSCDEQRSFRSLSGYAELELGACWNCNDWTSDDSGNYEPGTVDCATGYATVGALVPPLPNATGASLWRICEARDKPLMCCIP